MTTTSHTVFQPVALVLDVSPSMGGAAQSGFRAPIDDLNDAIQAFVKDVRNVKHCAVEIAVFTFACSVEVLSDFEHVEQLNIPTCQTRGSGTNLGGAIARALDEVQARRDYLKQTGMEVKQPWLVCVTDGQPNLNTAPGFDTRLVDLVNKKRCVFLPVAVGGYASYDVLERLSPLQKPVVVGSNAAGSLTFADYFKFLSQSMAAGQIPNLANLQQANE